MSSIRLALVATLAAFAQVEFANAQEPVRVEFSGDHNPVPELEWSRERALRTGAWIDSVATYIGETVRHRVEASWIVAKPGDETDRIIQISVLPLAVDSLPTGLTVFSLALQTAKPDCGRVLDGTQLGAAIGARESARLILHFIDDAFAPEGPD